jgi:hypothetical protein
MAEKIRDLEFKRDVRLTGKLSPQHIGQIVRTFCESGGVLRHEAIVTTRIKREVDIL